MVKLEGKCSISAYIWVLIQPFPHFVSIPLLHYCNYKIMKPLFKFLLQIRGTFQSSVKVMSCIHLGTLSMKTMSQPLCEQQPLRCRTWVSFQLRNKRHLFLDVTCVKQNPKYLTFCRYIHQSEWKLFPKVVIMWLRKENVFFCFTVRG